MAQGGAPVRVRFLLFLLCRRRRRRLRFQCDKWTMEEEREGFYVVAARRSAQIDVRVSALFAHTLALMDMTDGGVCLVFEESKSECAFEDGSENESKR